MGGGKAVGVVVCMCVFAMMRDDELRGMYLECKTILMIVKLLLLYHHHAIVTRLQPWKLRPTAPSAGTWKGYLFQYVYKVSTLGTEVSSM